MAHSFISTVHISSGLQIPQPIIKMRQKSIMRPGTEFKRVKIIFPMLWYRHCFSPSNKNLTRDPKTYSDNLGVNYGIKLQN